MQRSRLQSPLTQPPSPLGSAGSAGGDDAYVYPPPAHIQARAARARRRALAAETARVSADLSGLFEAMRRCIAHKPAVASAQPACPVCMGDMHDPDPADVCSGGARCECNDAVRLRCCGGDLHRRCLLRYAHSQFETSHFRDAMHDAIAWSARGEFVSTARVVRAMAARGEFTACPLCRGALFFESRPARELPTRAS